MWSTHTSATPGIQHIDWTKFRGPLTTYYTGLNWQKLGSGTWPYVAPATPGVTVYASTEHTFLVINGRVFSSDTQYSPTGGPHWRTWDVGAEESGDIHSITWVAFHVPGTA